MQNEVSYGKPAMRSSNNFHQFLMKIADDGVLAAAPHGIKFIIDLDPELPNFINFNLDEIEKSLLCLINNAIRFSHRKNEIRFSVFPKDEGICFQVRDEGLGIPRKELPVLFDDKQNKKLLSVKEVIASHHGHIDVESQVGVGSTFTFWIPNHLSK